MREKLFFALFAACEPLKAGSWHSLQGLARALPGGQGRRSAIWEKNTTGGWGWGGWLAAGI